MKQYLEKLLSLAQQKYRYEKIQESEYATHVPYLHGVEDEIKEVWEEVKHGNHIFLQDELADMVRDMINTIYTLEQEGYIPDHKAVFQRAFEKYNERRENKKQGVPRNETKVRQAAKLQTEHDKIYLDQ